MEMAIVAFLRIEKLPYTCLFTPFEKVYSGFEAPGSGSLSLVMFIGILLVLGIIITLCLTVLLLHFHRTPLQYFLYGDGHIV